MRIAHILWSMGTGGTENMVVDIASVQAENNEVCIFVINDWVEEYMLKKLNPKCKVELMARKPGSKNPLSIIKLNWKLWKFAPDILHLHSYRSVNCIKVCRNKPMVRTIHGLGNYSEEYPLYRKLISISKAVSDFTKNQGFDSLVIPNGIRVGLINHSASEKFEDGKLHFIQVSRLHIATKAQDVLIKALAKVKNAGVTNFQMHFVGDGEDYGYLNDLCHKLDVTDLVTFEGRWEQQKIYSLLANYDLFIQPSRNEGFGLTIAEAMAANVPVLVSDIPAPMEVIDNGTLGMSFKNEDPSDCAEKLLSFIRNGKNQAQVEDAYQYVKSHYDVSVTAQKYLEVYESIFKA